MEAEAVLVGALAGGQARAGVVTCVAAAADRRAATGVGE
jgi:hypothetical protein